MIILCLSKQRPQGRNLLSQPYGRFHYLPRHLADKGHEVHLLLLNHKREATDYRRCDNLHTHSVSGLPWGPYPYLTTAKKLALELKPDWFLGFSDTWYGILAQHLASAHGSKSLIDAYDNYESYIGWAKPLHFLWRRALCKANIVTAAGPHLGDLLKRTSGRKHVEIIPMAADPGFVPLPKQDCRTRLGLPVDVPLLGYSGAIDNSRDIEMLFTVHSRLRELHPRLELVLSGRLSTKITVPHGVHWLGYRPAEEVPAIINSLDLMLVLNKPGDFGDYSYPAKLYEAMACGTAVVAADVAGTAWILRDNPDSLAKAGDIDDFVARADHILRQGHTNYAEQASWKQSADILDGLLTQDIKY